MTTLSKKIQSSLNKSFFINFDYLKYKFERFFRLFRFVWKFLKSIFSPRNNGEREDSFKDHINILWEHISNTPIFIFYTYLWNHNKTQFSLTLFINYVLPFLLELLPWYFSSRQINRKALTLRNEIKHSLISGEPIHQWRHQCQQYLTTSLLYAVVMALERQLRGRVSAMNGLVVKRMVLERLLYAEVWAVGVRRTTYGSDGLYTGSRSGGDEDEEYERYRMNRESNRSGKHSNKSKKYSDHLKNLNNNSSNSNDQHNNNSKNNSNNSNNNLKNNSKNNSNNSNNNLKNNSNNNQNEKQKQTEINTSNPSETSISPGKQGTRPRSPRRSAPSSKKSSPGTNTVMPLSMAEFERRVSRDINSTLTLFSFTIPRIIKGTMELVYEIQEIYSVRNEISPFPLLLRFSESIAGRITDAIRSAVLRVPQAQHRRHTAAALSRILADVMDGLVDIQLNNLQPAQLDRFDSYAQQEINTQRGIVWTLELIERTFSSHRVLSFLTESIVTHIVMQRNHISHQQFRKAQITVDHAWSIFTRVLRDITHAGVVLEQQHNVVGMLTLPNFLNEDSDPLLRHVSRFEELILKDIKFSYDGTEPYALNFSGDIKIQSGKRYALIGQNRSGKSTLVHLISKIYEPNEGMITINGINYNQVSRSSLRSLITYVSQRPFIFQGTIYENITISNQDATEDEVIEAAAAAGVFAYGEVTGIEYTSNPVASNTDNTRPSKNTSGLSREEKLDILYTPTDVRGSNLSGGFGQSVALARIFLRPFARILILDESFSAMDPMKRNAIMPRVLEFAQARSMALINITHDMSMTQHVDHIVMLEAGAIVHQGSHEELVRTGAQRYLEMIQPSPAIPSSSSPPSTTSNRNN